MTDDPPARPGTELDEDSTLPIRSMLDAHREDRSIEAALANFDALLVRALNKTRSYQGRSGELQSYHDPDLRTAVDCVSRALTASLAAKAAESGNPADQRALVAAAVTEVLADVQLRKLVLDELRKREPELIRKGSK
jgi:hypothetical protein